MLHHYPPQIPQQIISIPQSLYTQPPHNYTAPSPPSPPTVTVSYLPPATSLYATLLQPLSIKLLQSFPPHLHQYQISTSTFGLAHLYPPHPLFVLTQSLPHVHLRPAHIVLAAPSQHALHDFFTQSELLLPCGGGRIELIESGERCCVRDLDGNLIEVQWSNRHSERHNGYYIPDAATQPSNSQRGMEKSLEYPYRERIRERREDRAVALQSEDRRLRQSSKNGLMIPNNSTLDSGRKPNVKNRRVLQWQKDVARSINDQDADSYSEEEEVSNEFFSSEDDEDPLTHARSYTHSQIDYRVRSGRNKPTYYKGNYGVNDNYQTGMELRGKYKHQKPYKYRNETKSKQRDSKYIRPPVITASSRADAHSESSISSPINQTRRCHYASKPLSNKSTNYNSRTERVRLTESDRAIMNHGGRRDSGIGGIGGYSDVEQDRGEFETRSGHKYKSRRMSIASKTQKDTRERYLPRTKPDPYNYNEAHGNSKERKKEKKLYNRSRTSLRHQDSYSSSGESDPASYMTGSSKSEFYNKPESSRIAKNREQEKRRKWTEERDRVRNLHRKQIKRELADKPRQESHRDYISHSSPVRSTAPRSPRSVSRSRKREKRQILARVPKPPSAVPLKTRERRETHENGNYDDYNDYDDISDGFEETDSEYDFPPTSKKSHRQRSSYRTSSQSNYDNRQRRGGSFNYNSGGKREVMSSRNRSKYDYATSVAVSESSSFEKENNQRDDRWKSSRRKSGVRY